VLDLAGLLLFSVGGGLFAWAWSGFLAVPDHQASPDDAPWAAVRMADGYWRLQKIGVALMLAGVAVFVLAWWIARRVGRSPDDGGPASPGSSTPEA
jgi:drug/metabolite transporter (DMT)-like permease